MRKAIKELHDYIGRKTWEVAESRDFINRIEWLNHRQQALLVHALKHPGQRYTVADHRGQHGIAYGTARTDLLGLAEHDFLEQRKVSKRFVFYAPADLLKRLKSECATQVRRKELYV